LKSAQNGASFDTLCEKFPRIFFQLSEGAVLIILEDKRSNKIETIQYFKNAFLKTKLRISRSNQNHMKHIEFLKKGETLDPLYKYSQVARNQTKLWRRIYRQVARKPTYLACRII
jgi:hypothetical protein